VARAAPLVLAADGLQHVEAREREAVVLVVVAKQGERGVAVRKRGLRAPLRVGAGMSTIA